MGDYTSLHGSSILGALSPGTKPGSCVTLPVSHSWCSYNNIHLKVNWKCPVQSNGLDSGVGSLTDDSERGGSMVFQNKMRVNVLTSKGRNWAWYDPWRELGLQCSAQQRSEVALWRQRAGFQFGVLVLLLSDWVILGKSLASLSHSFLLYKNEALIGWSPSDQLHFVQGNSGLGAWERDLSGLSQQKPKRFCFRLPFVIARASVSVNWKSQRENQNVAFSRA